MIKCECPDQTHEETRNNDGPCQNPSSTLCTRCGRALCHVCCIEYVAQEDGKASMLCFACLEKLYEVS